MANMEKALVRLREIEEKYKDCEFTTQKHYWVWNAVTKDESEIPAQSIVVIEEIRGNKLLVSPAKQRKEA